jgi:ketosteroid isomerase-like protein
MDNMNSSIKSLALALLISTGFVAYDAPQDAKDKGRDPARMQGPPPTAEHKLIAESAGSWKCTGKLMMGAQPIPLSGVQTNTMQPGGLWQVMDYKADDGSFVGHGIFGYDTNKKKFVSIWVDSMHAELSPAEGTRSADDKVLTMDLMTTDPGSGQKRKATQTITRKDDKTFTFEMTVPGPDGKRMTMMEMTYSRMSSPVAGTAPVAAGGASDNERLIRELFAAFNRHDVEGLAALYSQDAYLMSSDFQAPRHGPEGVRQTYSALFAQLPEIHDEVKTLIVRGDEAAVEFVSTWGARGQAPAGRLEIATFFKFKNGKIISDITYFDVPGK